MNEKIVKMLEELDSKGYTLPDVIEMIRSLPSDITAKPVEPTTAKSVEDIEVRVTNLLRMLGVPAHIKGYQYLRRAIVLAYETPEILKSITKELYPKIAKEFQTTSSAVDRSIRYAIECAWNRCDLDVIQEVVGNTVSLNKAKPTNSKLIALLADRLHMEDKQ